MLKAIVAVLAAGAFAGCATMSKGTTELVMISSDPPGADFSVNDITGKTPFALNVPSSKDLTIHVSAPGYQAQDVQDPVDFRWGYEIWSFIDFVIPMGVDLADGAAWGHQQTTVAVHLHPVTSESKTEPSLQP